MKEDKQCCNSNRRREGKKATKDKGIKRGKHRLCATGHDGTPGINLDSHSACIVR